LDNPSYQEVVYEDYPEEGHHGWKFIALDLMEASIVPVGAPCNHLRIRENPNFASNHTNSMLKSTNQSQKLYLHMELEIVGFDWHTHHRRTLVYRQWS